MNECTKIFYYIFWQHSTMTSTLRRLGEDILKGVVTKGIQDNSLEHSVENKPKTAAFFKSSSLPLRFLSTLIVLKTVTQGKLSNVLIIFHKQLEENTKWQSNSYIVKYGLCFQNEILCCFIMVVGNRDCIAAPAPNL